MMEQFFFQMWYKKKYRVIFILLLPLSAIYYVIWKIADFYYTRLKKGALLESPVISVGNITLGGTGKTPFILYLLEMLLAKNKKVLVLSRGYGGSKTGVVMDEDGFSDEVRLLKRRFPKVEILAGKDRLKNYFRYIENNAPPDIVILDDGFQHRKICRDIDIVMFDGELLIGNGALFPAGPLREPLSSVSKRADMVILKDGSNEAISKAKSWFSEKRVINFRVKGIKLVDLSWHSFDCESLKNKNVVAFCGIGNPESFRKTLLNFSIPFSDFVAFNDHINYTAKELKMLASKSADYYITTEKDAVKLAGNWFDKAKLLILVPEFEAEENILEILGL